MNDFLISYKNEITTVCISIVVSLITSFLTHFMENSKLRYIEKLKISSQLSAKKYEGITKIRENIRMLKTFEDLCITEDEQTLIPENRGKKVHTPACCYSYEKLQQTAFSLNELHSAYGDCLSHKSVIYLCYIRNFLLDYLTKCKRAEISDELLRWVSVPLYKGIHRWYKMVDRELINSMNSPSFKYYAHSGFKYDVLLKMYGFYFYRTAPYKYMHDKKSLLNMWIENPEILNEEVNKHC